MDEVMEAVARECGRKGLRPYVIPEGGSSGVGALGYVRAAEEMVGYVKANGVDAVFCAVGSGGTYAGLWAGMYLQAIEAPLFGILVADDIPFFRHKLSGIIREMEPLLGRKLPVSADDFLLSDRYIGPGYARLYPEAVETIRRAARFGIVLDPVYTAKTFYGMLAELGERDYRNPLFIHTGGIFGLFPFRHELFTGNQPG